MPRVEMRILLLGATGSEPSFSAWEVALAREGVPFESAVLTVDRPPIRFLDGRDCGRFQGVIFATGGVTEEGLRPDERRELRRLELDCGVRRLIAYACPGPAFGLHNPAWSGPLSNGDATVTAAGQRVFPYLRGRVAIDDGSWAYLAIPLRDAGFETLLAGPGGAALVGVHTCPDGREEMVQTVDSNAAATQSQLLRHGQLAWITRGCFLGYERNYLPIQIDDVLLPNRAWSVAAHADDENPSRLIRMSPEDAARAARWARARQLRIDLGVNGSGSARHTSEHGLDSDRLLTALLDERDAFGWVNHTFRHTNLDAASQAEIETEIAENVAWADRLGIVMQPHALVTGEHTGLANPLSDPPRAENPALAPALRAQQIRYIGCDASRPYPVDRHDPQGPQWPPGTLFSVGPALAVPRHPTALPYDAATPMQVLDRARSFGASGTSISFKQLIVNEARRLFGVIVSNDPRPHFFHQSNLAAEPGTPAAAAEEAVFYALLDPVLDRYAERFTATVPLLQPTLGETAELLRRWSAWRDGVAAGSIRGYLSGTAVTIVNDGSAGLAVPLTGVELGDAYGGMRSGWIMVEPGQLEVGRPVGR